MAETVVELANVTKKYGNVTAVDNLSLKIEKGETFGFLGPNGAGKSTTIKMLTGFLKPDSGVIKIMGHDMASDDIKAKEHIGLVPDEYGLYDDLTATEHLRFYGALLGIEDSKLDGIIKKILDEVELVTYADNKVKGFSHGMRQRLIIGQALMGAPEILFLDEPTNGLDPIGAKEVRGVIQKMAESGMTLFISSHVLHEVQEMCKSVGIVQRGRLIKKDSIENLSNFLKDKTGHQVFITCEAQNDELAKLIGSTKGVKSIEKHGMGYRIRLSEPEALTAIPETVIRSGNKLKAFYEMNPSLEDVFMDLVEVKK